MLSLGPLFAAIATGGRLLLITLRSPDSFRLRRAACGRTLRIRLLAGHHRNHHQPDAEKLLLLKQVLRQSEIANENKLRPSISQRAAISLSPARVRIDFGPQMEIYELRVAAAQIFRTETLARKTPTEPLESSRIHIIFCS